MSEMNLNGLTKAELLEKLEELQKKNEELTAAAIPAAEVVNNDPKRRVKIRIDLDKHDKEPVYVSVNDYTATIQRGVEVEVPYFVAKHLQEMRRQNELTIRMISNLSGEWETKSNKL